MQGNPLLLGGDGGYRIERSLRLRASASAYLSRTPSITGNQRTFTFSVWVKRGALGVANSLLGCSTDTAGEVFDILNDKLRWASYSLGNVTTSSVLRDPSAHYHIHLVIDSTEVAVGDRVRISVNGVRLTAFDSASYPTQNATSQRINTASATNYIGGNQLATAKSYLDGLLSEVHFVDGQALDPSAFGETDPVTGVWMPKKYTGTYGVNGFYLDFKDNSAATATAIGKDSSGNGNNWTPTNISVSAGVTYDSFIDTPTNYADDGNGRGNYATLNPLDSPSAGGISQANLYWYSAVGAWHTTRATMGVTAGKWYWEVLCTNLNPGSTYAMLGVDKNRSITISSGYPGASSSSYGYYSDGGSKFTNGATAAYGAAYVSGDTIGVALDLDAGTLTFYKNGVSQEVAFSGLSGEFTPAFGQWGSIFTINFGQRPFAFTPPAGFKALNTQNLPEPIIKKPKKYFDVLTYAGTGAVRGVTGSEFRPDLVWMKSRNIASSHVLQDTIRGATRNLSSNTTGAEATDANSLTSFNADGFSLGIASYVNTSGDSYVSWLWKESPLAGFDIVSYTGTGMAGLQVPHSLGVAPSMVITKSRTATGNWAVYHKSNGPTGTVWLNVTNAFQTNAAYWNNAAPTSSVFSVGSSQSDTNASGVDFIAYVFAEVPGFSKFGSYVGNGSADGRFVYCGFKPRYVMVKRVDATGNWFVVDSARTPHNPQKGRLLPNLPNVEDTTSTDEPDFTANGFKLRGSGAGANASGGTYIFAAFAEHPFKYARAR